jgi:hypothetical protein
MAGPAIHCTLADDFLLCWETASFFVYFDTEYNMHEPSQGTFVWRTVLPSVPGRGIQACVQEAE